MAYDPEKRYRIKVGRVIRMPDKVTVFRPDHHQIVVYGDVASQIEGDIVSSEELPPLRESASDSAAAAVATTQAAASATRATAAARAGKAKE